MDSNGVKDCWRLHGSLLWMQNFETALVKCYLAHAVQLMYKNTNMVWMLVCSWSLGMQKHKKNKGFYVTENMMLSQSGKPCTLVFFKMELHFPEILCDISAHSIEIFSLACFPM